MYIHVYALKDPHTSIPELYAVLQFIFQKANQVILNHKLNYIRLCSTVP